MVSGPVLALGVGFGEAFGVCCVTALGSGFGEALRLDDLVGVGEVLGFGEAFEDLVIGIVSEHDCSDLGSMRLGTTPSGF